MKLYSFLWKYRAEDYIKDIGRGIREELSIILPSLEREEDKIILPCASPGNKKKPKKTLKEGEGMIWGVDVSKDFIIAYDGKRVYKITNKDLGKLQEIFQPNDTVIMEQTGAYGVRYAQILTSLGCKVIFADGKRFNAFRHGKTPNKSDFTDAKLLREFYLSVKKHCYEYNPQMVYTRALIRQHIRNKKDVVKHMNRLRQYLAIALPDKEYYNLPKDKFLKALDEIETDLYNSISPFIDLALIELRKLRESLKALKRIEEELKNIAQNHPDYEILKSFPHLNDITIATLIAYYWDIRKFKDADSFIGYVLMGVRREQSGKKDIRKTDKARTEIKGNFYMVFMQAHKKNSPLKPLTELVKIIRSGTDQYKKRYIKFLDFLFRLIYIALKERVDFKTALRKRIQNIERDLEYQQKKNKYDERIFKIQRSLHFHFEILKLAESSDISPRKSGERVKVISAGGNKNEKDKRERNNKDDSGRNKTKGGSSQGSYGELKRENNKAVSGEGIRDRTKGSW